MDKTEPEGVRMNKELFELGKNVCAWFGVCMALGVGLSIFFETGIITELWAYFTLFTTTGYAIINLIREYKRIGDKEREDKEWNS